MSSATTAPAHNYAPRSGFDDSGASGLYHTARPSYPRESIRAILEAAASNKPDSSPLNILEIGSGTGISTESLLREAASSHLKIHNYLAIEPSHGMRAGWNDFIASKLLPTLKSEGKLPSDASVECRDGTFEDLNVPSGTEGTWDAVVIAQAYHWCPDYEKSLKAILNALRPGGQLALIWNLEDNSTRATWVKDLRDLYEVYEDGTPQCEYWQRQRHVTHRLTLCPSTDRHGYWKKLYDLPITSSSFKYDTAGQHFTRTIPTTVQGVKNRVLSKSYISIRTDQQKQELQSKIDELFAQGDDKIGRRWIDEKEGVFEYPYVTGELWCFADGCILGASLADR